MNYLIRFAQEKVDTSYLPGAGNASSGELVKILDYVFTVTGAIALLVITIAGLRYIISRGDPSATAQAKDTILYACVGLVVSIAAYTIVTFVANSVIP